MTVHNLQLIRSAMRTVPKCSCGWQGRGYGSITQATQDWGVHVKQATWRERLAQAEAENGKTQEG